MLVLSRKSGQKLLLEIAPSPESVALAELVLDSEHAGPELREAAAKVLAERRLAEVYVSRIGPGSVRLGVLAARDQITVIREEIAQLEPVA